MDYEMKRISEIRPYKNNPRNNEKSVEKVASSIREFGFLQPIVCDGDGVILAGHTRYHRDGGRAATPATGGAK